MDTHLRRSIHEPIREGLSRTELWDGEDGGLIWCWELGRQKRLQDPDLAARAEKGKLVVLAWKGGVQKKLKVDKKGGTLYYLATWQGLHGEDLDIALEDEAYHGVHKDRAGRGIQLQDATGRRNRA